MPTLFQQEYTYTSGSGVDKWTYKVLINSNGEISMRIISSPLGAVAGLDIPESVVDAFCNSVDALQASGGISSGSTGTTGTT